ncbi:MAG: sigma-70 family RNA polymerase sigma factor [Silicimonas sp.]|nr:sigma-70 family RNA polymerase sigma factor [Silicimonas sp.]
MPAPDPREDIVEHLPALWAFAVSLTRNATLADDMVQDTAEKAWANFDQFKPDTKLRAWLFTILRNHFYSHIRKAGREVEDIDGAHAARLVTKPAHDGWLRLNEVMAATDKLSAEQREALLLVGALGFTYEEAARICGITLGTLKSRMNRGRTALCDMLEVENGDDMELTDPEIAAVLSSHINGAA